MFFYRRCSVSLNYEPMVWVHGILNLTSSGAGKRKEIKMILTRDGVTREQLAELLEFSQTSKCQFNIAIHPPRRIKFVQNGSVISFMKIEEEICRLFDSDGKENYCIRFHLKICIEDYYYQETSEGKDGERRWFKSGQVPTEISEKVLDILNSN